MIFYFVENHNFSFIQLLAAISLFGDFFNLPNFLGGVDWTLRLEVIFYIFTWIIFAIYTKRFICIKNILFGLYSINLLFLVLPTFPGSDKWNSAYVSIFFITFFGGIALALVETYKITALQGISLYLINCIICTFQFIKLRPDLSLSFLIWGYSVFLISFLMHYLNLGISLKVIKGFILWFSSLTYPIYLFHNWFFNFLDTRLNNITKALSWNYEIPGLATIAIFIILMHSVSRLVELPMIRLSKRY